jgi:hypothetical protein
LIAEAAHAAASLFWRDYPPPLRVASGLVDRSVNTLVLHELEVAG